MSITKIDIINAALIKAGCDIVSSLNQPNSRNARIAESIYDISRQEILRLHPWNFATERTALAALTDTPAFDYTYQYQLPADCLRVVRINIAESEYKIEGRKLLTDDSTVNLIYIKDIEDTSLFDVMFRSTLIAKLAMEFCSSIRMDQTATNLLAQQFEMTLRKAKQIDGQEQTADQLISNTWTNGDY